MQCKNKVFAELFGLAIFDLQDLSSYKFNNLLGNDLLDAFITSETGDEVTKNGVVIPILGITGDYYCLDLQTDDTHQIILGPEQIKVQSTGWILHSSTGEVIICGVGYLKQFDSNFITKAKYIKFNLTPGWYEVIIIGGIDSNGSPHYNLLMKLVTGRPTFKGNLEDNFNII